LGAIARKRPASSGLDDGDASRRSSIVEGTALDDAVESIDGDAGNDDDSRLRHREVEHRRRIRMKAHFEELNQLTAPYIDMRAVEEERRKLGHRKRKKRVQQLEKDDVLVNAIVAIKELQNQLRLAYEQPAPSTMTPSSATVIKPEPLNGFSPSPFPHPAASHRSTSDRAPLPALPPYMAAADSSLLTNLIAQAGNALPSMQDAYLNLRTVGQGSIPLNLPLLPVDQATTPYSAELPVDWAAFRNVVASSSLSSHAQNPIQWPPNASLQAVLSRETPDAMAARYLQALRALRTDGNVDSYPDNAFPSAAAPSMNSFQTADDDTLSSQLQLLSQMQRVQSSNLSPVLPLNLSLEGFRAVSHGVPFPTGGGFNPNSNLPRSVAPGQSYPPVPQSTSSQLHFHRN